LVRAIMFVALLAATACGGGDKERPLVFENGTDGVRALEGVYDEPFHLSLLASL
jgi:hypothetical protein